MRPEYDVKLLITHLQLPLQWLLKKHLNLISTYWLALMLHTVQRNVHVCMSPIPKGSTVSLTQYVCGEATTASSQTTAATWRLTNVCPIYPWHLYWQQPCHSYSSCGRHVSSTQSNSRRPWSMGSRPLFNIFWTGWRRIDSYWRSWFLQLSW